MKKIIVSACLLGTKCRYDGSDYFIQDIPKLLTAYQVIAICPELLANMPTPRPPVELLDGKALDPDGVDYSEQFERGANAVLAIAKEQNIEFALLKSGSPSCGSDFIYDGTHANRIITGMGVCAAKLKKAGVPVYSENNLPALLKHLGQLK